MAEDSTSDFDTVCLNPAAYYGAPADVYNDAELTRAEKLRLLEEWETDLSRQLESDGEGMAQGQEDAQKDESRRANDAAMLKQAANYRRMLGEEQDKAGRSTALGRVWRRLFSGDRKAA